MHGRQKIQKVIPGSALDFGSNELANNNTIQSAVFNNSFEKSLKSNIIIRKTNRNRSFCMIFCLFYVKGSFVIIERNV
jgi:hypothetical protein